MADEPRDVKVQQQGKQDVEMAQDQPVFTPATDIYEKSDAVLVLCDLPGVDEKHVDVSLENNVLTITGYQDRSEPEGCELLYRGYESGVFRRSFTLTSDIDRTKITAKIANGVLRVLLPKAPRAQTRKIEVQAGD